MDLLARMKEICRIYEISPQRSKGQNFLVTESVYDDIIKAAEVKNTDTVLEVGPGLGFLTAKLAQKAKRVVAVELDDRLAEILKIGIDSQGVKNVEVVNQDILKFNPETLGGPYKVVANLPYNISSIFLRTFLGAAAPPDCLALMLQKEVAERIISRPPDMSLLALSVQYYGEARITREVKAGNFWPEPKVDSAILAITTKPSPLSHEQEKDFFRLARVGFSAKRKMLKNNLAAGFKIKGEDRLRLEKAITDANLIPSVRAEDLSLSDWLKLFAALKGIVV